LLNAFGFFLCLGHNPIGFFLVAAPGRLQLKMPNQVTGYYANNCRP
jgi:hypothetical protein